MNIKASACAALIVAASIVTCLVAPLHAQESTGQAQAASSAQPVALGKPVSLNKYSKHRSRYSRRHARKSSRTAKNEARRNAAKSSESKSADSKSAKTAEQAKASDSKSTDNKANESTAADTKLAKDNETSQALPSSVANARAQLPGASASNQPAATPATAETPKSLLAAAMAAAAARADGANAAVVSSDQLNDVNRSLTETSSPPAATIAMASLSTPLPTATISKDDSTWAHTSLIGKLFIAFGGLLTLASAARMLIA